MQNECWGIILAAGQGRRMAEATGGEAKQFLRWKGVPLWWHSAKAMAASPAVHGLVFVFPPDRKAEAEAELFKLDKSNSLGVRIAVAEGGARRQDSVRHGLEALPAGCARVLVHDSARPFLSTALTTRLAAPSTTIPAFAASSPACPSPIPSRKSTVTVSWPELRPAPCSARCRRRRPSPWKSSVWPMPEPKRKAGT